MWIVEFKQANGKWKPILTYDKIGEIIAYTNKKNAIAAMHIEQKYCNNKFRIWEYNPNIDYNSFFKYINKQLDKRK